MMNKLKEIYNQYLIVLWNKGRIEKIESKEFLKNSLKRISLVSGVYLILYLLFYIIKFSTYQIYNNKVILELAAKGSNPILKYINTYPGNVIYIFISLLIFSIAMIVVTYLFTLLFEIEKRDFSIHAALTLRSVATSFSVFPLVLLINSLFPLNDSSSKLATSTLIASWIILAGASYILSLRNYIIDNESIFEQPKRRSAIVWTLPFYFVLNFMFGVIFN